MKGVQSPLIWGFHSVLGCLELRPELVAELWCEQDELAKPRPIQEVALLLKYCQELGLKINKVSKMPGTFAERRHQGVGARLKNFGVQDLRSSMSELTEQVRAAKSGAQWAYIDGIQDPRNFGAILRSAAAFGVEAVLFPTREQSAVSGLVAQASAGQIFRLQLVELRNPRDLLDWASESELSICALDGEGQELPKSLPSKKRLWILGSEGEGIRKSLRDAADSVYRIPMADGVESLNASVAASIAFYVGRS